MSNELKGYWKERPSEDGDPISNLIIASSDGFLKLMFENKFTEGLVGIMEKCLNVINSIPAPQCFYDWEKTTKTYSNSNDFRRNLERYVVAETKKEQDFALSKMNGGWMSPNT